MSWDGSLSAALSRVACDGGRQVGCVGLTSFYIPFSWAEVPAIEGMRMHLLEETTVRTEWTRAPGPVDAYEIQFIPTVRATPGGAEGRPGGGSRAGPSRSSVDERRGPGP